MNGVTEEYVKMIELVAKEMTEYAAALRADPKADWSDQHSTYTLEAVGAVGQLLEDDGVEISK